MKKKYTREERNEISLLLIEKYQAGDEDALIKLREIYEPLTSYIAEKEYYKRILSNTKTMPIEDLEQEAFLALRNAVKNYNISKGTNVFAYFWTFIEKSLIRENMSKTRLIKMPRNILETQRQISSHRYTTTSEIAKELKKTRQHINTCINSRYYSVSDKIENIPDNHIQEPYEACSRIMLLEEINNALNILNEKQRKAIQLHILNEISLRQAGKLMNLSGEIIRQLEKEGLKKIRLSKYANSLKTFR